MNEETTTHLPEQSVPAGYIYLGHGDSLPFLFHPFDGIVYRSSIPRPHWEKTMQNYDQTYRDDHSLFAVHADGIAGQYLIATREGVAGDAKKAASEVISHMFTQLEAVALRAKDLAAQVQAGQKMIDGIKARQSAIITATTKFLRQLRDEDHKVDPVIIADERRGR